MLGPKEPATWFFIDGRLLRNATIARTFSPARYANACQGMIDASTRPSDRWPALIAFTISSVDRALKRSSALCPAAPLAGIDQEVDAAARQHFAARRMSGARKLAAAGGDLVELVAQLRNEAAHHVGVAGESEGMFELRIIGRRLIGLPAAERQKSPAVRQSSTRFGQGLASREGET